MNWKGISCAATMLLSSVFCADAAKISVKTSILGHPEDESVGLGEVPGYIRYSLNNTNKDELQEFLEILIKSQFNSEIDGSFLVTLAVSIPGDEKPLAERTLMSGTRKSKKFLFFTTNQTDTGTVDLGGTMLDGITVSSANNGLKISLRTYYSDKVSFDTSTMQNLMKLNDALQIAQFLAIPALVSTGTTAVNDFVGKILTTAKSQDLTTATQLQFIKKPGQAALPNRVRFSVQAYDWDGEVEPSVTIGVDVRAETMRSLIGNYDSKFVPNTTNRIGFFNWAKPTKFLESAVFTLGKDKVSLFDLIENGGPKTIATGVTILRSGAYDPEKNQKTPLSEFCNGVYSLIRKGYPERDAVGLYWDFLNRLKDGLSKSTGALTCVSDKADLFRQHGLPTDQLLASIKS